MSETTSSATLPAADPVDITPELKAPRVDDSSRNLFRVLAAVSFCHLLNEWCSRCSRRSIRS